MKRRTFLKTCGIVVAGLPFLFINKSKDKRSPKSLFTIEELRTWCEKNGFHYIEDDEIITRKVVYPIWSYDRSVAIFNGTELPIVDYPFIYRKPRSISYDQLNYDVIECKMCYQHFGLYDIVESTLPSQKNKGEFYANVYAARCRLPEESLQNRHHRLMSIKRCYDVRRRCWIRPIVCKEYDAWWYVSGFEST